MNTRLILELLKKGALTTDALLNVLIGGNSYRYLRRKSGLYFNYSSLRKETTEEQLRRERHNFYSLLSRLQKQGLVASAMQGEKLHLVLTQKGSKKLKKISSSPLFPKRIYLKEKDDVSTIVVFDIPEKLKAQRAWLRENLITLGFTLLQKSVWIGENKLPSEFLHDLRDLKLIDFIHILKVVRRGTL